MKYRNYLEKEQGLTAISLIITIIVVLILVAISIRYGKEIITKTKLQELKTNMLFMQATAMKSLENVKFDGNVNQLLGTPLKLDTENSKTEDEKKEIREKAKDSAEEYINMTGKYQNIDEFLDNCYYLTDQDLTDMGLKQEIGKNFLLIYNISEIKVEVIYVEGFKQNDTLYHSLEKINQL